MIDIDEVAAARLLYKIYRILKASTKQRFMVIDAIERKREKRVIMEVPRKKRSLRNPISSSSSSSFPSSSIATKVYSSKEDLRAHIHGPLMEYLKNAKRNSNQRAPPLSPPMETQPKRVKRETDGRFAAGDSSLSSIVEYASQEDLHGPSMESPTNSTSNEGPPLEAAGDSSSETTTLPPEWLLRLMISKNGAEPKKIIEKELTATDVNSGNARLSMPFSQIVDLDFLNPKEETIIDKHVNKERDKGVDAKLVVVSPNPREYDVNLRRWNMEKKEEEKKKKKKEKLASFSSTYNLVTGWNKVVKGYGLKKNDKIHLWSFHVEEVLYFALLPPPPLLSASATSDSGESNSDEISSALMIDDKSNDDLSPK